MNTQQIINSIRVGNEHIAVPNHISIVLNHELPLADAAYRQLLADGISYSTNGGVNWANISKATLGTPENAAGDDPAPVTADLDQIDLSFDPQDSRRLYLLRTTASPLRAVNT